MLAKAITAGMVALVVGGAAFLMNRTTADASPIRYPSIGAEARDAMGSLEHANESYSAGDYAKAKSMLEKVVAQHESSGDRDVQDVVAHARMKLGYTNAKLGDFGTARKVFIAAEQKFQGTETRSDFGGGRDQAAYQAAATLMAENKRVEAEEALVAFMRDYPMSPLVHGAWKRLGLLNGGQAKPEHDQLLQECVTKQEKQALKDLAMCGPLAIQDLLKRLNKPSRKLEQIYTDAKTTESGSTMYNLSLALKTYGVETIGRSVNRHDLKDVRCPSILLADSHYMVIVEYRGKDLWVYDPYLKKEREFLLPPFDDPKFTLAILEITKIH